MILLDTHIWRWYVDSGYLDNLTDKQLRCIFENLDAGLGVSIVSCWEIAKKVEIGKLELNCPIEEWLQKALNYKGIRLISLTPEIVIESTKLPGAFHRDPFDQVIVATSRILKCPLVTSDEKILDYSHVITVY